MRPQGPNLMDDLGKSPDSPEGWPWVNPWPRDKAYAANTWIDKARVDEAFAGWKKGDPLGFLNDRAPEFSLPEYGGERYEAMVPDTLEIQERAALGVHALTEQTNPDADHEIYGSFDFTSHPIVISHSEGSICFVPKFMEALVTCRLISGSEQNKHVEQKWLDNMLRMQGADGRLYAPTKGRPWFSMIYTMGDVEGGQVACPFDLGRYLVVLTDYYRLTGDDLWLKTAERLVDGLRTLAADAGDHACFRRFYFGPEDRADSAGPDHLPHLGAAGWVLNGLGIFLSGQRVRAGPRAGWETKPFPHGSSRRHGEPALAHQYSIAHRHSRARADDVGPGGARFRPGTPRVPEEVGESHHRILP